MNILYHFIIFLGAINSHSLVAVIFMAQIIGILFIKLFFQCIYNNNCLVHITLPYSLEKSLHSAYHRINRRHSE